MDIKLNKDEFEILNIALGVDIYDYKFKYHIIKNVKVQKIKMALISYIEGLESSEVTAGTYGDDWNTVLFRYCIGEVLEPEVIRASEERALLEKINGMELPEYINILFY